MMGANVSWITVAFVLAVGLIAVVGFYYLSKDSERIHGVLRDFKRRAEETHVLGDLRALRLELETFYNKECWHRHYASHAKEVDNFIKQRIRNLEDVHYLEALELIRTRIKQNPAAHAEFIKQLVDR